MNSFLGSLCDRTYISFCRFYGLDLYKVNNFEQDFFKKIKIESLEHISIQSKEFQVFNSDQELGDDWKSPEGYFVDWNFSYQFQDLGLLEGILEKISSDLEKEGPFVIDDKAYLVHPNEYRFVLRTLYRKSEEKKLENPQLNYRQCILSAIDILKNGIELDKIDRNKNKQVRLNNFTKCNIQYDLSKKSAKHLAIQVIAVSSVFFFTNSLLIGTTKSGLSYALSYAV